MLASDELALLIKSRYPVVFVESVDEEHVLEQLVDIARQFGLTYYEWSLTEGLRRRYLPAEYPNTQDPDTALRTIPAILESPDRADALFVFKDFPAHLDKPMTLRLFKDLINLIRNSRTTVAIVAPTYKLPVEIEPSAAYMLAGYPNNDEIVTTLNQTIREFHKENKSCDVNLSAAEEERLLESLRGLTQQQIRNVIIQCLFENTTVDGKILPLVEQKKQRIFDRDGLLEFCAMTDTTAVGGFDNLKQWLAARKGAFYSDHLQLPAPKGVLLLGVQGCGKSLAAKMIAREFGISLYRLDLVRFYSKYIGETEQNLRKALKTVDQLSPVCLWVDEIEKGFASSSGDIDGGVSMRLLGTFLTWMQERTGKCFIAATANDVHSLPPELLRKGRFDEIFFVDLPGPELRSELFRIHIAKRGLDSTAFDCAQLAALTPDFSGAEIEQAVISALYSSTSRKETITSTHICNEIARTKPLSLLKKEEISALRQWAGDRTIPA